MSTRTISCLVCFLDSDVMGSGGGNEEPEDEVTEMTSWGPLSRFLLRLDEAQTRKGGEEKRCHLRCDGEAHWTGRTMSAERRLHEGVGSIVRRTVCIDAEET